jgi:hypothetical protein
MTPSKTIRFILLLAAALLSACVPNRAWRIHYAPGYRPAVDPPLFEVVSTNCKGPGSASYRLAFVEFDDRGEFFERDQLNQALRTIREAKEIASKKDPAAVVLFVHGWKNNASDRSGNVAGFKSMLGCLAAQFNPSGADPERTRMVGIYVGWRGAVVSAPVLKELTFWDRRDESRNLPGAHVVETLLSIMKTAKGPSVADPNALSFLIGHSFGGGLLETAVTQTFENIILDTPRGATIQWPADLTVLINEAAPASQAYQLVESMKANVEARPPCGPGQPERDTRETYLPAIISLTSKGDWGTGTVFPVGQALSLPFNSLRTYPHPNVLGEKDQVGMYLKTTAHTKEFISHVIDKDSSDVVQRAEKDGCQVELKSDEIAGATYNIVEQPGSQNLSPYWVMQLPTDIVPDHSTIFGTAFRDLITDLVLAAHDLPHKPYKRK